MISCALTCRPSAELRAAPRPYLAEDLVGLGVLEHLLQVGAAALETLPSSARALRAAAFSNAAAHCSGSTGEGPRVPPSFVSSCGLSPSPRCAGCGDRGRLMRDRDRYLTCGSRHLVRRMRPYPRELAFASATPQTSQELDDVGTFGPMWTGSAGCRRPCRPVVARAQETPRSELFRWPQEAVRTSSRNRGDVGSDASDNAPKRASELPFARVATPNASVGPSSAPQHARRGQPQWHDRTAGL